MLNTTYSEKINRLTKLSFIALVSKDYLNMEAVFSDETENFVSPSAVLKGEPVTFKIRVAKNNVDKVIFVGNSEKKTMSLLPSDDTFFDFYAVTLPFVSAKIDYYFQIEKNGRHYFFNKRGLYGDVDSAYNFTIIPSFSSPDWAKGAVMYQIYVDRFFDGDESNNVVNNEYTYLGNAAKHIENWDETPANLDVCNFYGGDLKGVMDKMWYLKDLGVEAIYFCPIFVSPSNHKYDIQDYDHIDPHIGKIENDGGEPLFFETFNNRYATKYMKRTTDKLNLEKSNELFCKLVEIAHANGIKVILDGVFNHCGAFNKWMDRENFYGENGYPDGAYKSENSPYHDYFKWYAADWPNNDAYDSWWGFNNHPKLNFEASNDLYEHILAVGKKWVSAPFCADGWRLDVAADLGETKEFNHKFWRDMRESVKSANSEAIILAEHYGDPKDWLLGDQWDTIMNYDAFMEPLTWFLTGMEKHSEEFKPEMLNNAMAFESAMRFQMARFSNESLQVSMNQLSNHDHSRFLTRTNRQAGRLHTKGAKSAEMGINKSVMMEAVTFQMTWPGSPTIYYGDEVSQVGWTDPDNRRTFPWGKEDLMMLAFHKKIVALRKANRALKTGSLMFLNFDYGFLSYARFNETDTFVILINNNSTPKEALVSVWKCGVFDELTTVLETHEGFFSENVKSCNVKNGVLNITLKPFSSMILKRN